MHLTTDLYDTASNNTLEKSNHSRLIHISQVGQEQMQLLYCIISVIKGQHVYIAGQSVLLD